MVMKSRMPALGVVLATFLWNLANGDLDVWCRWNSSCVLEVTYPAGDDLLVRWLWLSEEEAPVHAFYAEADQLANQDGRFRGRTSLFGEKLREGNASLLLKNVVVGDEGRYKCAVATLAGQSEFFFQLHVEAPVTIQIEEFNEELVCSSRESFPEPQLTWTTRPTLPHALRGNFKVLQNDSTLLYGVVGNVAIHAERDVEYVCDVGSSRSVGRGTWRRTTLNISDTSKRIRCASVTDESGLAWTFNTSELIASRRAGQKYAVADAWAKYVEDLSEDGGLHLRDLTPDRSGEYTCVRRNASQTRVNVVFLRLAENGHPRAVRIELWVVIALLAVFLPCIIYCVLKKCKRCQRDRKPRRSRRVLFTGGAGAHHT
ncbi:uncharacterized protein LOC144091626 [Stigmatopora argus]